MGIIVLIVVGIVFLLLAELKPIDTNKVKHVEVVQTIDVYKVGHETTGFVLKKTGIKPKTRQKKILVRTDIKFRITYVTGKTATIVAREGSDRCETLLGLIEYQNQRIAEQHKVTSEVRIPSENSNNKTQSENINGKRMQLVTTLSAIAVSLQENDLLSSDEETSTTAEVLPYMQDAGSQDEQKVDAAIQPDKIEDAYGQTVAFEDIADRGEVEFFDYDRLTKSQEYDLNYAMSKIKPGAVVVRDILDQRDGTYIQERDTLLQLVLRGCAAIQKEPKFWSGEADENDRNRELARMIQAALTPKDQTQGGHSGTGNGIGELDIEILNNRKVPIAILEALNTTSINTANWRDHLNKLVDNYNTSGLRYLILTSYVSCKKTKFLEKFKETAAHWKKVEPKELEGCFEGVDTLVMDECPELIRITRADYVRNNFKLSVYHFLVHIGGEEDSAAANV